MMTNTPKSSNDNSKRIDHPFGENRGFMTTRWSIVVASTDRNDEDSKIALQSLCESYWYPLYAYLRRKGNEHNKAQDLTQAFFIHLLEKESIAKADKERGKFRTFLLTALNNFVANQWQKDQALKRGGGVKSLSLHFEDGKSRYENEPIDELTPERLFERRWAMTILEQAMTQLKKSYEESGKADTFAAIKVFLGGGNGKVPSYQQVADQLGISLSAVKVAIHRMKKKCGEMLRREIANTLREDEDIEIELRYLMEILSN